MQLGSFVVSAASLGIILLPARQHQGGGNQVRHHDMPHGELQEMWQSANLQWLRTCEWLSLGRRSTEKASVLIRVEGNRNASHTMSFDFRLGELM